MPETVHRFFYREAPALSLPAERESFPVLREWLERIAGEQGFPDRMRKQLLIAADEIFTNIASYAYPGGKGTAEITVELLIPEHALMLTFADSGVPYNPLEAKEPDVTGSLAERKVGGLGIFVVKRLMDEVTYRRADGKNLLTLKKIVPGPEQA